MVGGRANVTRGASRWLARMCAALCLATSPGLVANNITIASEFTGDEPVMTAPQSCVFPQGNPYKVLGTIQVDTAGTYQLFAASDELTTIFVQGIPDFLLLVYEHAFDPGDSSANLLESTYRGAELQLEAGTPYILVAQYCADLQHPLIDDHPELVLYFGPIAVVVNGPGTISGAGVESAAYTWGHFSESEDSLVPPGGDEAIRYQAGGPVPIARSGNYFIGQVLDHPITTGFSLLIYEGQFDPGDPSANLVTTYSAYGRVYLQAGKSYIFVAADSSTQAGKSERWQFVIFPPGAAEFNSRLSGAWVSPGIGGQGLMVHAGGRSGILFFAWFTFAADTYPVTTPVPGLGSDDQRWLTGYGTMPEGGNMLDIRFENTSGGVFNTASPEAVTDSDYGTGWIEMVDCERLNFAYSLPGGHQGELQYHRIIPDSIIECAKHSYAGPWVPLPEQGQ